MCFNPSSLLQKSLKWALKDGDLPEAELLRKLILELDKDNIIIRDYYQVSAFAHPKVIVYGNGELRKPIILPENMKED